MTERLDFYYRNGCHLCEEMAAALFRGWPREAEAMRWHDVDSREEWLWRYGTRVPVLMLDGELLCEYVLDPARLVPHFGPPANPL